MTTLTRQEEIKAIHKQYPRLNFLALGIIFLLIGILVGFHLVDIQFLEGDYPIGLYSEFISIIITIVVLDQINEYRATRERKLELFDQAKSRSNDMAVDALEKIQRLGWWDELLEHYRNAEEQRIDLSQVQWAGAVNLNESDLQGADLSGANLQEAGLDGANLQEANLEVANLQEAKLLGANLQEANLGGANLQDATLVGANLQEASLRRANLQGADLYVANLQEAKLFDANLQEAYLKHANLQDANLVEANLQKAYLWGANLQDAYLWRANLQDATLVGANLQDAYLWRANLQDATLVGAMFSETTVLPDSKYVGEDENGHWIFDKYWTPDTDMSRYTDPNHPDFWQPDWVKEREDNTE